MSNYEIILNMIVLSIPEALIMTLIALVAIRRYDYLDKYNIKQSIVKMLLIVVVPYAVLTTCNLHIFHMSLYIRIIINLIGLNILLILLLKGEEIFKIFISTLLSMAIIFLSEFFTLLIFIYIFGFDISLINTSPWINFLVSAPFRILQASVLYMIYIKKNSIAKFKIIEIWNDSRVFRRFMIVHIGFNIFISLYIFNKFTMEKGLENLPEETRLPIVIIVFILHVMELILPWVIMYVVYPIEKLRGNVMRNE